MSHYKKEFSNDSNYYRNGAKQHHKHPLSMTKGQIGYVWFMDGQRLTIRKGPKGEYVSYQGDNGPVFVNVNKLYKEIFTDTSQVVFSKGQLLNQNRRGVYETPNNTRKPLISLSGYILRGKHIGKKLSELSNSALLWYFDNHKLNYNELTELEKEIQRREKK